MKKRLFSIVLCSVVATVSLFGCGSGDSAPSMAQKSVEAEIFVDKVDGITDDFIRGVDISSILSEEKSGVTYKNAEGATEDIFKILSDAGINYVRVRVWNNPFDKDGNGYGGGNCDVQCAAEIGRRAAEYGMKLCVDFHYSDFWADPAKQKCPKEWEDIKDIHEKADKLYDYTKASLETILASGSDVGIVQLGNETNKGMAGEKQWSFMALLFDAGNRAVKEVAASSQKEIKTAVHFTNPEDIEGINKVLSKLESNNIQYDIFALSYYPFWHGTLDNLTATLTRVANDYGKEVMVAETSYEYTLLDGDGHANSAGEKDLNKAYSATVQSQANAVRDVCDAVAKVGEKGLGVFYWEPAWIPVNVYDYTKSDAESVLNANKEAWEKYGSGWASSYAKEYDPSDAGKYFGGSSWDNQAMFDFEGNALPSLYVFKYLKYGATCDLKVDFAPDLDVTFEPGETIVLPETAEVSYNDRSKNGAAKVTWNEDELSQIDTNVVGDYVVNGTFEDGSNEKCNVHIAYLNLVPNYSFEEDDRSMWVIDPSQVDFQQKESDCTTGEYSMHYWSESPVSFDAYVTIDGLEDGIYYFSAKAQGGDAGNDPDMYIYAKSGDAVYTADFISDGWVVWQSPEIDNIEVVGGSITIGVHIDAAANAWGTLDDFYLCKKK